MEICRVDADAARTLRSRPRARAVFLEDREVNIDY